MKRYYLNSSDKTVSSIYYRIKYCWFGKHLIENIFTTECLVCNKHQCLDIARIDGNIYFSSGSLCKECRVGQLEKGDDK